MNRRMLFRLYSEIQQQDDGIEVDIDSFGGETLWELDRLVTNYKKSLSKIKRRLEIAQAKREAIVAMNPVPVNVDAQKEIRTVGKVSSHSLPVQGENNGENGSISSTSSSSSSDLDSSSDSDRESSSTDSDGEHSPKT